MGCQKTGFESRFINLADQINSNMPRFVVNKVADALNEHQKSINGSRIHIFGVAYKKMYQTLENHRPSIY